jgi:GntR family transcriptional regulator / MocR family aminotransferase
MSATRRLQLLNWAVRTGAWIIEDDYDSEYRFDSRPIASLQGLDTSAKVIYVGTFSKMMFPALRVGYLVVPKDLVAAFSAARDAADVFSATLYQAVLTDFIREGHFARHIRRMRMLYVERRRTLAEEIRLQMAG